MIGIFWEINTFSTSKISIEPLKRLDLIFFKFGTSWHLFYVFNLKKELSEIAKNEEFFFISNFLCILVYHSLKKNFYQDRQKSRHKPNFRNSSNLSVSSSSSSSISSGLKQYRVQINFTFDGLNWCNYFHIFQPSRLVNHSIILRIIYFVVYSVYTVVNYFAMRIGKRLR